MLGKEIELLGKETRKEDSEKRLGNHSRKEDRRLGDGKVTLSLEMETRRLGKATRKGDSERRLGKATWKGDSERRLEKAT